MEGINITVADFDGVTWHVSNLGDCKTKIMVSIAMSFYADLEKHGIKEVRLIIFVKLRYSISGVNFFFPAFTKRVRNPSTS